jgi:tetratricopeptide (TPR) repeat protein
MRRHAARLIALALFATALAGCAGRLLHRNPSAVTTVRAPAPGTASTAQAQKPATKAERQEAKRAAKQARAIEQQSRAAEALAREAGTIESRQHETAATPAREKPARVAHAKRARVAREKHEPAAQEQPANAKRDKPVRQGKEAPLALPSDPLAAARMRMQQQPDEPWWPYQVAQLEAQAGSTAAAEGALRTALERDSAYAPALSQLSRMLYEQGRHEEAVGLLTPVREHRWPLRADEQAALLSGLALHEAALGRDDAARDAFGQLARDERDEAIGVGAYLAVRGSSVDSAAKLTAAAVAAAPGSAANHNNRGIALLRAGDPNAAAGEFERAIALDPKRPGPWYNLTILEHWYRLDPDAAAKRFQQYWRLSHADPDSLYAELGHRSPAPLAEEVPNR